MKTKSKKTIRLTLLAASKEFCVARETLRRALRQAETPEPRDGKYSVRECHLALAGDAKIARARLTAAKASREELKFRHEEGELIDTAAVFKAINDTLLPVRQRLMALPSEAASMTNPADPQFARAALREWVSRALAVVRDAVPEGKK